MREVTTEVVEITGELELEVESEDKTAAVATGNMYRLYSFVFMCYLSVSPLPFLIQFMSFFLLP